MMRVTTQHNHEHLLRIEKKIDLLAHQVVKLKHATRRWAAGSEERDAKIMATLDDLVAAATDEDTKIDSLIALVVELKAKVDAIVSGELSPEQQAKLDAAFAAISDNPQRIQDAIDANTTPEPPAP